ncbi:hypothetical protein PINS_up019200 [Pythium insidiosum]|nr:hypothetical protein PINS_up019200 [Pythium insidiosum]
MHPLPRRAIRVLALLTVAALGVGIALSLGALLQEKWRVADGFDNELVAPSVVFERLRIGESKTCVQLRRFSNTTNAWTSRETCYRTFLGEDQHPTTVLDLQTGQQLILNPVCDADAAWVAEKLGIPKRLDVVSLWNKQCSGFQWVDVVCHIFAIILALFVGSLTFITAAQDDGELYCNIGTTGLVPAIPLALHTFPTFVWLFAMDATGFEMGICLRLALITEGIFAWTWVFNAFLCFISWCTGDDIGLGWFPCYNRRKRQRTAGYTIA